jgi:phospholipid/cholesterol/gamma-HCH transport system ATP-binding protein
VHGPPSIRVEKLTMAFDGHVLMHDLDFSVARGAIFFITGPSGSGKTTLLRHLVGLQAPAAGQIFYGDEPFVGQPPDGRAHTLRRFGVLFQSGGLFTSMTLAENVALPLDQFTTLDPGTIDELVRLKLRLVGLAGFERFYPSALSGGMRKRAGLARAMALDPEILFLDEPSAGLDPDTARRLDELILDLRGSLGATVVVVSHELPSIFAIGDDLIFLDPATRTLSAHGPPAALLRHPPNERVARFLTRGGTADRSGASHA